MSERPSRHRTRSPKQQESEESIRYQQQQKRDRSNNKNKSKNSSSSTKRRSSSNAKRSKVSTPKTSSSSNKPKRQTKTPDTADISNISIEQLASVPIKIGISLIRYVHQPKFNIVYNHSKDFSHEVIQGITPTSTYEQVCDSIESVLEEWELKANQSTNVTLFCRSEQQTAINIVPYATDNVSNIQNTEDWQQAALTKTFPIYKECNDSDTISYSSEDDLPTCLHMDI